jgi:hypothetical protein
MLKTRIDPRSKDNHTVYMVRKEGKVTVASFTSEKPCTVVLESGPDYYFYKDNGWSSIKGI